MAVLAALFCLRADLQHRLAVLLPVRLAAVLLTGQFYGALKPYCGF